MNKAAYEHTLKMVTGEIARMEERVASLDLERMDCMATLSTLRETAAGLTELLGSGQRQPITALGLTDACRQVLRSANSAVSAAEIRDQLQAIKYDFSGYEKPISSIATALNRMVERGEATVNIADDGTKRFTPVQPLDRLKRMEERLKERRQQLLEKRGKK
jgi:hypothetical protein